MWTGKTPRLPLKSHRHRGLSSASLASAYRQGYDDSLCLLLQSLARMEAMCRPFTDSHVCGLQSRCTKCCRKGNRMLSSNSPIVKGGSGTISTSPGLGGETTGLQGMARPSADWDPGAGTGAVWTGAGLGSVLAAGGQFAFFRLAAGFFHTALRVGWEWVANCEEATALEPAISHRMAHMASLVGFACTPCVCTM